MLLDSISDLVGCFIMCMCNLLVSLVNDLFFLSLWSDFVVTCKCFHIPIHLHDVCMYSYIIIMLLYRLWLHYSTYSMDGWSVDAWLMCTHYFNFSYLYTALLKRWMLNTQLAVSIIWYGVVNSVCVCVCVWTSAHQTFPLFKNLWVLKYSISWKTLHEMRGQMHPN